MVFPSLIRSSWFLTTPWLCSVTSMGSIWPTERRLDCFVLSFGCGCLHKSQFEVVVWFWFSRFIHGRMSAKLPITFWNSKGCLGNLLPSRTICLLYLAQKLKVALPVQHPTVRLVPGWQDRGSLVGDPLRPGKKPAAVEPRSYGDLGDAQRQAKKAKKEVCFSSCWCVQKHMQHGQIL